MTNQFSSTVTSTHNIEIPEQSASLHIKSVILWTNGMVMSFSDRGEQMPAYQGTFESVVRRINNVFTGAWEYGDWNLGIICNVPLPQREVVPCGLYPLAEKALQDFEAGETEEGGFAICKEGRNRQHTGHCAEQNK